jgi:hypothetical protein
MVNLKRGKIQFMGGISNGLKKEIYVYKFTLAISTSNPIHIVDDTGRFM